MRGLARLVGLLLVAAGFIGLVVDGTRSIVNETLAFSSLRSLWETVSPASLGHLQAAVTQHVHPMLWDPVLTEFLLLPASIAGLILGLVFLWLGQKPLEPIGYLASH
ncbi:hypothetical protein [Microvirga pudoricolor]|uniref:hypothetical protein n=1 Tax=Microvirga pudoricolor TaxID=2778729 RepID=UPI00194E54A6|nr:hypothetical protein [Microvirga pudoricolor]MBM6593084.1 hypothetical protein [Microvirga pudoricolor]